MPLLRVGRALTGRSLGTLKGKIVFKYGPIPASFFVFFRPFHITIQLQMEKDVVLGIQTRGRKMVGANGSIELWRPSKAKYFYRCELSGLMISSK